MLNGVLWVLCSGAALDEEGFVYIMDDVITVSGHRLYTGEMEDLVARHPAVLGEIEAVLADLPRACPAKRPGQPTKSSSPS